MNSWLRIKRGRRRDDEIVVTHCKTRGAIVKSRLQIVRAVSGRVLLLLIVVFFFVEFTAADSLADEYLAEGVQLESKFEWRDDAVPYLEEIGVERLPSMIPGTVEVEPELLEAVGRTLQRQIDTERFAAEQYAVSDIAVRGDWHFVSVIGLVGVGEDLDWNLTQNGNWFGLLLMSKSKSQGWTGAVEGTQEFSRLLEQVPESILSEQVKHSLDQANQLNDTAAPYRFPWRDGSTMKYVINGIHSAGFPNPDMAGWLAVDLQSDGDTGAGHAPNMLLAAASGTVSYRCTPLQGQRTTAVKIGDLLYAHLLDSADITLGKYYNEGDEIGPLISGSFYERCGYANQTANEYHVHWGFPNTGSFQAGGWTLSFFDEKWRRGDEVKSIGSWLLAEGISTATGSIEGTVLLQGRSDHSGVEVCADDGSSPVCVMTGPDGAYSIEAAEGSYGVTVEMERYLDAEKLNADVTANGVTNLLPVTCLGGDSNDDCMVNILDISLVGGRFGLSCGDPNWDARADINDDCVINILDLSVTGSNFGGSCPVPWD